MHTLNELRIEGDRAYISVSIDGRTIQKRLDNNEETHQEDFAHLESGDQDRIIIVAEKLGQELESLINSGN